MVKEGLALAAWLAVEDWWVLDFLKEAEMVAEMEVELGRGRWLRNRCGGRWLPEKAVATGLKKGRWSWGR